MTVFFEPFFSVKLSQHPVGQGGLMSGLIRYPRAGNQLHWVYDCGANKQKYLNAEIEVVAGQGHIDYLFLSHLDSDHVNGIDGLLIKTHVREVILPYLSKLDQLVAISHELSKGNLSSEFLSFLNNIEEWFASRGVERITYIYPDNDGNNVEGPLPPNDKNNDGQNIEGNEAEGWTNKNKRQIKSSWLNQSRITRESILEEESRRDSRITPQYFQTGASLFAESEDGELSWLLMPYAHRPTDEALQLFISELEKVFPSWSSVQIYAKKSCVMMSSARALKNAIT